MRVIAHAALAMLLSATASAAVLHVDCDGGAGYSTMQEAVDAASHGDTLVVAPCVCEETVQIVGKSLVIIGSGSDATELRWAGPGPTLSMESMPTGMNPQIVGLSVTRSPVTGQAIHWDTLPVVIEACTIEGAVVGGWDPESHVACVYASDSSISSLNLIANNGYSEVTTCVIGEAEFSGGGSGWAYYPHRLESHDSEYGRLSADRAHLTGDTVTELTGLELNVESSWLGDVEIWGGKLTVTDSHIGGTVNMHGPSDAVGGGHFGQLRLTGNLIEGSVLYDITHNADHWASFWLSHNTILGSLSYEFSSWSWSTMWPHHVRGNVVGGSTALGSDWAGWPPVVTHNDFVGGWSSAAPVDSVFANMSVDPLFCDPASGDYQLEDCSPCVGGNHDGTDIGAFGVGCPCATATEHASWGAIKSMFR